MFAVRRYLVDGLDPSAVGPLPRRAQLVLVTSPNPHVYHVRPPGVLCIPPNLEKNALALAPVLPCRLNIVCIVVLLSWPIAGVIPRPSVHLMKPCFDHFVCSSSLWQESWKRPGYVRRYMDVWEWTELVDLRRSIFPQQPIGEVQERYDR
jgi:hypothetical protein